ncbi:MAG TPA: hypothetical protein VG604_04575 [Candidatus Saccharimonadales bacterium]|nr:hypothetical protein [Candidatus Saccharimonadales bacterium]
MAKSDSRQLIVSGKDMKCHHCGGPMRQISWKVTAGSHDAGKEVEQTVYQCPEDKNTICIELTTGDPSEFAYDPSKDTEAFDS